MEFNKELENSTYYDNYNNLPKNRKSLLEEKKDCINCLQSSLFDFFDIEEVYITEKFLIKETVNPKLEFFIKMKSAYFADFLDKRDEIMSEDISIICEVQGMFYHIIIDKIEECEKPQALVQIPNEKLY